MEILTVALILCFLISLYNMWMSFKLSKSIVWLLKHVHVVGKAAQKDPNFEQIKRTFGIEDEGPDNNV